MAKVQNPAIRTIGSKANIYKAGLVELATQAEVNTGTDTERVVTAETFAGGYDVRYLTKLATASETRIGTSSTTMTTPADIAALKQYTDHTFSTDPIVQIASGTFGLPAGATGETDNLLFNDGFALKQFILGAGQTILAPSFTSSGLSIGLDLTALEGAVYYFGHTDLAKHLYTIGTSAAFFLEATIEVTDCGTADPIFIGFRKQAAPNADYTTYTDAAFIGLRNTTIADKVVIGKNLNNSGWAYVNSTDAWADTESHTLRVNVSAAGVVTYLIDGVAPTTTQTMTFDSTDVVIPHIQTLFAAAGTPAEVYLTNVKCGLQ